MQSVRHAAIEKSAASICHQRIRRACGARTRRGPGDGLSRSLLRAFPFPSRQRIKMRGNRAEHRILEQTVVFNEVRLYQSRDLPTKPPHPQILGEPEDLDIDSPDLCRYQCPRER